MEKMGEIGHSSALVYLSFVPWSVTGSSSWVENAHSGWREAVRFFFWRRGGPEAENAVERKGRPERAGWERRDGGWGRRGPVEASLEDSVSTMRRTRNGTYRWRSNVSHECPFVSISSIVGEVVVGWWPRGGNILFCWRKREKRLATNKWFVPQLYHSYRTTCVRSRWSLFFCSLVPPKLLHFVKFYILLWDIVTLSIFKLFKLNAPNWSPVFSASDALFSDVKAVFLVFN